MESSLKDRRKLKLSIGLMHPNECKSPVQAFTPTFVENEIQSSPVITDQFVINCSKCSLYKERIKGLQEKIRKMEEVMTGMTSEMENLKDVHKSSTVHAMIKKLDLQAIELQHLSVKATLLSEENTSLSSKLLKSQKIINSYKENLEKTIKSFNSKSKKLSKTWKILPIHHISILPDPFYQYALTSGRSDCKIFITEQQEEIEKIENIQISEIVHTESTKTPKTTNMISEAHSILKAYLVQLSNDFSEFIVLFQSFVEMVLFSNSHTENKTLIEIKEFEEKSESKKIFFHLLLSINQKLVKIKNVFHEAENIKTQTQELDSSTVSENLQNSPKPQNSNLKEVYSKISGLITNSSGLLDSSFSSSHEFQSYFNSKFSSTLDIFKVKIKKLKKSKRSIKRKIRAEILKTQKNCEDYVKILQEGASELLAREREKRFEIMENMKVLTQENKKHKQELEFLWEKINNQNNEISVGNKINKKLQKNLENIEAEYLEEKNSNQITKNYLEAEILNNKQESEEKNLALIENAKLKERIKKLEKKNYHSLNQKNEDLNEIKVENELLNRHIEKVEEELYETLIKFDKVCEERNRDREKIIKISKRLGFEQFKGAIMKLRRISDIEKVEQILKKVGFEQFKGAILKLKIINDSEKVEQLFKRVGFEQFKGAILKMKRINDSVKVQQLLKKAGFEQFKGAILKMKRINDSVKVQQLLKKAGFEQFKGAILKMKRMNDSVKVQQLLRKAGFEQFKGAILKMKKINDTETVEQLFKRIGFEQLKAAILKLKIEEMSKRQMILNHGYENLRYGFNGLDD